MWPIELSSKCVCTTCGLAGDRGHKLSSRGELPRAAASRGERCNKGANKSHHFITLTGSLTPNSWALNETNSATGRASWSGYEAHKNRSQPPTSNAASIDSLYSTNKVTMVGELGVVNGNAQSERTNLHPHEFSKMRTKATTSSTDIFH